MPSPSPPLPSRSSQPRRRSRTLPLLIALLAALTLLGGCARVRAALAVQPDDTVVGEIVVATPEQGPDDPGPKITLPAELADEVDVSEYRQEGYTGSLLSFSGLTFAQLSSLTAPGGPAGDKVRFTLRRAGNRVLVDGAVNLKSVPGDRADFQLKISFPGEVLQTNGDADGGLVSWVFKPGEAPDISAIVAFDDPDGPSTLGWSLGLGGLVALAAAAVVVLARRTRNPPISPPTR